MAAEQRRRATKMQNGSHRSPEQVPMLGTSPVKAKSKHYTLDWNNIPLWQQDNRYILSGYRPISQSFTDIINSLSYVHNQTVNIYSHLLAVPVLLLSAIVFLQSRDITFTSTDHAIFFVFLLGMSVCFLVSATFHTFSCHSDCVRKTWVRRDYVGIIVLTVTTFVSGEYYLFYCEPIRMGIHFFLTISIGTATIVVILTPKFQTAEWRTFRLTCFCLMGIEGFVPMIDSLLHYGWDYSMRFSLGYYLFEMLLEMCGAITYGSRIPERFWPGKFDIWGSSHQWFHFFSVAAACVHLAGLMNAVEKVRLSEHCSVPGASRWP